MDAAIGDGKSNINWRILWIANGGVPRHTLRLTYEKSDPNENQSASSVSR
jgi:hypothetical protein